MQAEPRKDCPCGLCRRVRELAQENATLLAERARLLKVVAAVLAWEPTVQALADVWNSEGADWPARMHQAQAAHQDAEDALLACVRAYQAAPGGEQT